MTSERDYGGGRETRTPNIIAAAEALRYRAAEARKRAEDALKVSPELTEAPQPPKRPKD